MNSFGTARSGKVTWFEYSYPENGTTLAFDSERCIACGRCREVCPHGVFGAETAPLPVAPVARERCMECGACMLNCPAKAIEVRRGVGCAAAIIIGALTGREPTCDCGAGSACCGGAPCATSEHETEAPLAPRTALAPENAEHLKKQVLANSKLTLSINSSKTKTKPITGGARDR